MFGHKKETPRVVDAEPFDEWLIIVKVADEHWWELHGHLYQMPDPPGEARRALQAIVDGLEAAGFGTEVTLKRTTTVEL